MAYPPRKNPPFISAAPAPSEYQIEAAFEDYLIANQFAIRKRWPVFYWTHIENEGHKHGKVAGARAKRLGKKAGVADRMIQWRHPDLKTGGLGWIEFKSAKGKLSDAQSDFLKTQKAWGAQTAVCYSCDEAVAVLKAWGVVA
jgi:hypothetical protein